ncbi:MAG: hypothetical protein AVDCRST_MAG64-817 [uncultured Phycisphaerae bacterium]|uniref:Uncharacterized protein n=1 Tax=uncultured Phycisphaerae bacterium TaxID=904963 RepID=A0A6J4NFM5_9BACT|nr:MAG: hypothetical protein AVDCRST_MAG64-817 [uncultured Phycisphaerae bacterium]
MGHVRPVDELRPVGAAGGCRPPTVGVMTGRSTGAVLPR